jgi:hypothetical protein
MKPSLYIYYRSEIPIYGYMYNSFRMERPPPLSLKLIVDLQVWRGCCALGLDIMKTARRRSEGIYQTKNNQL